ncbi:hypothetical protein KDL44_15895 [bacterium]|nr:hypothetical protein [bacterium]
MTGNGNISRDPLDLARSQMDFARMADDAPSVKEVLFKAQTIIPVAPAKPLWQKAAPVAGGVLAAGLLFVPVLPESASLDRVNVNFEQSLSAADAQAVQFAIRNDLPSEILMGSSFSGGSDAPGLLSLSFSAAGEPRLLARVGESVEAHAAQHGPLMGQRINEARSGSRDSIVNRALSLLSSEEDEISYIDPSNHTARELLDNPELLRLGLERVTSQLGYSVATVSWLDREALPADEADYRVIELDCWPRPLRVEIDAVDLASFEHADLRTACNAWLTQMNLGPAPHGLASRPGELLPVMVEVRDPDGRLDRALTDRLQALIVQPDPDAGQYTDTSTWKVQSVVESALAELMGERTCYPSYERVPDPAYNREVNCFWVYVKMSNSFEKKSPVLDQRTSEMEQKINF